MTKEQDDKATKHMEKRLKEMKEKAEAKKRAT